MLRHAHRARGRAHRVRRLLGRQPDDYPEPDIGLAPSRIAPAATTGPGEERIWEFEKDWTTWTPARVAESRGSTN